MKPILAAALVAALALPGHARPGAPANAIQEALAAELARGLHQLDLPGVGRPFYLGYALRDLEVTVVRASLGALVTSNTWRIRDHRADLLMGDAFRNNAHFVDPQLFYSGGAQPGQVPLDDDPAAIRTALWLATDQQYKRAAEILERKRSALRQQKLPETWARVPDLDASPLAAFGRPGVRAPLDRAPWERTVRDLSAVLLKHPGIQASEACFFFIRGDRYHQDSQGGRTVLPVSLAVLHLGLRAQAEDGLSLADSVVHYAVDPAGLPALAQVQREAAGAATHLEALRQAAPLDTAYDGPILFEDQAAGELFAQRLFSPQAPGLVAVRRPLYQDRQTEGMARKPPESLEDKLHTRILPPGFRIRAVPGRAEAGGVALVGSFPVDAESVAPPAEVTLVEGGILKDLLRGRVPTPACPASNGHLRPVLDPYRLEEAPGPGVVEVTCAEARTRDDLRRELLRLGREAGLKHAYIVRKLAPPCADPARGGEDRLGRPVHLFRVDLASGREQPVRGGELGAVPLAALRRIAGASAQALVHNTLVRPVSASPLAAYPVPARFGWSPSGVAASFIVPRAVLFADLELAKETSPLNPSLPAAPSPL